MSTNALNQCPRCESAIAFTVDAAPGDTVCPHCGKRLWRFRIATDAWYYVISPFEAIEQRACPVLDAKECSESRLREFPRLVQQSELLPVPTPTWDHLLAYAAWYGKGAMSNPEREFLAEILQANDDPIPRSIYADWLEEQGDIRAEWIREEIESRITPDGYRQRLEFVVARGVLTVWQCSQLLKGCSADVRLGEFHFLSLLERSDFTRTYLAETEDRCQTWQITVFPEPRDNECDVERLSERLTAMKHPNLVRVCGAGVESGTHYLVLEHSVSAASAEWVCLADSLPLEIAAYFIKEAAHGLQHAHDAGFIHDVVTPHNIVFTLGGRVQVSSVGFRELIALGLQRGTHSLGLRHIDYYSPEQVHDPTSSDRRSNIFALGCCLYFLLTGQPLFHEGGTIDRLTSRLVREPIPLSQLRPEVPRELEDIHHRMCATRPEERYQTMREVADELTAWLATRS